MGQTCRTDAKCIRTVKEYNASVRENSKKQMVVLQKTIPSAVFDLRYATPNNFTHSVLYRNPIPLMRLEPAEALANAQKLLLKNGYGIKVWDVYRPFSVTCKMWQSASNRHFVANPRKGSNHNRGLAIDLILVELKTGKELDMGTGFDNFTDSANHYFKNLSIKSIENRKLLKDTMKEVGFTPILNEWWHYSWHNDNDYEVIDLDFDSLKATL